MPYSLNKHGAVVVAHLTGTVDSSDWIKLIDDLDELIGQGPCRVVLDLTDLESIDSSGLGSIVQLVSRCRMRGSAVGIANPNAFVTGVLEVTRLDQWIGVSKTVDQAITNVGAMG